MSFRNLYGSSSGRRGGRNPRFHRASSGRNRIHGRTFSYSLNQREGRASSYDIFENNLEIVLQKDSCLIPIELLKNKNDYERLLNDSEIGEERLLLIIKLLEKSVSSRVNKADVIDLFFATFNNPNFCQHLTSFISKMKYETRMAEENLQRVSLIITEFLRLSPSIAFPLLSSLVDLCNGVVTHIKNEKLLNVDGIEQSFHNVQAIMTEIRGKLHSQIHYRNTKMIAPPDDFREHRVVPTCSELNDTDEPFLQPNIVKGGYANSNHYLDIQFRLLKEDFIRPLRLGVQEFKKTNKRSIKADVRIYTRVFVDSTAIKENEFVYNLKLNFRSKFKVENSKRLMYGNILCVSNDNFETMVIATIMSRDELKNNLIAVKLETEPFVLKMNQNYTVIESKAYFVAYKHTLKALQEIREVPLSKYIVDVKEINASPDYLSESSTLVLSSEIPLYLYFIKQNLTVRPFDGINKWPSSEELMLDESQRRALYAAITRQMAIIQGPPGTGKTYLGLLVTKIILRNKLQKIPSPILVVCYTNHALDQFLQGMLSFTNKICRMGSHSQVDSLIPYQINKLLYSSLNNYRDGDVYSRYREIKFELKEVKSQITNISQVLKDLKKSGILSVGCFRNEFQSIIPSHLRADILRNSMSMFDYLKPEFAISYDFSEHDFFDDSTSFVMAENNDIEEEIKREEYDRKLADSDDEYDDDDIYFPVSQRGSSMYGFFASFEVTPSEIINQITKIENEMKKDLHNSRNIAYAYDIEILKQKLIVLKEIEKVKISPQEYEVLKAQSYSHSLDFYSRWKMYKFWKVELNKKFQEKLSILERKYMRISDLLLSLKNLVYLDLMKKADVVGMTTTAAAQYCEILHDLAPPIVIVEEAAEILEAHLVTSLSEKCQHLILIGDHQQLRPKPNVFELARYYHMDVSFFERMIKNGISYETLEYQHRMRPSISDLLVPTIYENLKDHESVLSYPKIRGVKKDLFFIDHDVYETEQLEETESYENPHEADFLMGLCLHLIHQGYKDDQVTIITPYLGQFLYFKQIQKRLAFQKCGKVRVSILDNYQGEESDIILLSLVRSNIEKKIGFMKIDNRVNVALSRAKHAMYIIGNMSQMADTSDLWKKINKKLVDGENIGAELELECSNHPSEVIKVKTLTDFLEKSPKGGCLLPCTARLPCQHQCPYICHPNISAFDMHFKEIPCTQPCTKILCHLGHQCPNLCSESCDSCKVLVNKELLCGHIHPVECSISELDFKCSTVVSKELPDCKHTFDLQCHIDITKYKCTEPCTVLLNCGHQCQRLCHLKTDPDHKNYDCQFLCEKNNNCEFGHKCGKKCFEDCGSCIIKINRILECGHTVNNIACGIPEKDIFCLKKCQRTLTCGHKCRLKCGAPCGSCMVMVDKIITECKHTVKMSCGIAPSVKFCHNNCVKSLPCSHPCKEKCYQTCTKKCMVMTLSDKKCPRDHNISLPCYLSSDKVISNKPSDVLVNECTLLERLRISKATEEVTNVDSFCTEVCGMTLDCGHSCRGTCGECLNGRLHAMCAENCNKTLICGHACKEICSIECPPCQERCSFRCSHRQHKRHQPPCGYSDKFCQAECTRGCVHASCTSKCGYPCNIDPCTEPCPKKLKCGHECIGYCGEKCPKLCRNCDKTEVAEMCNNENMENARFVLLEDCDDIFESLFLDEFMDTSKSDVNYKIGMKLCPKCKTPIYNTKRYQNIIVPAYELILKVREEHIANQLIDDRINLRNVMIEVGKKWTEEIDILRKKLCLDKKFYPQRFKKFYGHQRFQTCKFYLKMLARAKEMRDESSFGTNNVLQDLIAKLMKHVNHISHQAMYEFACELRRIEIIGYTETFRKKAFGIEDITLSNTLKEINNLMKLNKRFDVEAENCLIPYLEELEKVEHIFPKRKLNILRVEVNKSMSLHQGHWYSCPDKHIYRKTHNTEAESCPKCILILLDI